LTVLTRLKKASNYNSNIKEGLGKSLSMLCQLKDFGAYLCKK